MPILREFMVRGLKVSIFSDRKALGTAVASDVAATLRAVLSQQTEANSMFAAAPSQNEALAALCAEPNINWNQVNAFHMDEYIDLPMDNPAAFRNFLQKALFNNLPFKSVHLLDGNADNQNAVLREYSSLLRAFPLDICLMGIGENGHIAFNDPSTADFNDTSLVKIVELEEQSRIQQVNDGCFASVADVPSRALTVTIPALLSAKAIFCVVPSQTKAVAVKAMLSGKVSTECPASILLDHTNAHLYLDPESAALL